MQGRVFAVTGFAQLFNPQIMRVEDRGSRMLDDRFNIVK